MCLEDATLTKIISPCPQRGSGRDKIVSGSDSRTTDGEAKTQEPRICYMYLRSEETSQRTYFSKVLKGESEFVTKIRKDT